MGKKEFSAAEIAKIVEGRLKGNPDIKVFGLASLKGATATDLSFLANKKYTGQLKESKSPLVIVGTDCTEKETQDRAFIVCKSPNASFSKVVTLFAPPPPEFPPGIHSLAAVAESAKIGEGVHIGPCAVIDENAAIGDGSIICAGTYIGQWTSVGNKTIIYPNVSIRERCRIGSGVIIHSGTVIGSDGFGFEAGPTGIVKIPQVGIVEIGDDVEIGANCAIDRARFGKTILKTGVKLDNLVHVAHNVVVGEYSMLIGQSGIAGSTEIGQGVIIAAQAGINGHITIGNGARIGGASGVIKDIPAGETVVGTPAEVPRDFIERLSMPKKVQKLMLRLQELEKNISAIKKELEQKK